MNDDARRPAAPPDQEQPPTATTKSTAAPASRIVALLRHLWTLVWNDLGQLAAHLGRQRLLAIALLLTLIASPWSVLTCATLAAFAAITFRRPGLIVALLPLAIPFAYQPKSFFGPAFPVVELLLLLALVTTLLHLVLVWRRTAAAGTGTAALLDYWDEGRRLLSTTWGLHAATLAVIATFSLFVVADPLHLRESVREWRTTLIEPIVYFVLARYWLRIREARAIALAALLGGAVLVALLAIGQVVTGQGIVAVEGVRRALGPYAHPNALALFLVRVTPFAAALLALADRPRRQPLLMVTILLLAVALVLTFSRGGLLGLVLGLSVIGLALGSRNARTGLLLVAGVGLGLVALAGAGFTIVREGGGSLSLRLLIWRSTLAMIRDHPAFGVGLDQFYYQYAPRYIDPAAWGERYTSHPHNLFLDFWVRLGIMGLAWVVWMLATLIGSIARHWRSVTGERRRLLVAAAAAAVAGITHGLIDNFFFLIDLAYLWWLLLALIQIDVEPVDNASKPLTEPAEGW